MPYDPRPGEGEFERDGSDREPARETGALRGEWPIEPAEAAEIGSGADGDIETSWLQDDDERTAAFATIEHEVGKERREQYAMFREALFDAARCAEFPPGPHGVVLWNGGDIAKEAAAQLAAERSAAGDAALVLADTRAGREMEQISGRMRDALGATDRDTYGSIYRTLEQPAWTVASQRLVESGAGRVDIVVRNEVSQDKVLQPEVIKAWNGRAITEIRFHQIVMEGDAPRRDGDGRIALRELFRKDW